MSNATVLSVVVWGAAMPVCWLLPFIVSACRRVGRGEARLLAASIHRLHTKKRHAAVMEKQAAAALDGAVIARKALQARVSGSLKQLAWMGYYVTIVPWFLVMVGVCHAQAPTRA